MRVKISVNKTKANALILLGLGIKRMIRETLMRLMPKTPRLCPMMMAIKK